MSGSNAASALFSIGRPSGSCCYGSARRQEGERGNDISADQRGGQRGPLPPPPGTRNASMPADALDHLVAGNRLADLVAAIGIAEQGLGVHGAEPFAAFADPDRGV